MAKKTINVEELKRWVNGQLTTKVEQIPSHPQLASKEYKEGLCDMLQMILHKTGNYKGFMYLDNQNCEFNTLGSYERKYF